MNCLNNEGRLMKTTGWTHPAEWPRYTDRMAYSVRNRRYLRGGFTLLELLIVVVILAIAAVTAIPMMSSAGTVQIRSAANKVAADLEYAKSLAISRGQYYAVEFYTAVESYQIEDSSGDPVDHPVKKGSIYVVDMGNEGLDRVDISSVDFGGDSKVIFNCMGSPENNGGTISLQADGMTMTITVEPVTGYVTIN